MLISRKSHSPEKGAAYILEVLPVQDGLFRLCLATRQQTARRLHDHLSHFPLDAAVQFEVFDESPSRERDGPDGESVRVERGKAGDGRRDDQFAAAEVLCLC